MLIDLEMFASTGKRVGGASWSKSTCRPTAVPSTDDRISIANLGAARDTPARGAGVRYRFVIRLRLHKVRPSCTAELRYVRVPLKPCAVA